MLWRRKSQTEPENGPVKECRDFCVFSELANWQCKVPELQMPSEIVLGFSEVDRDFKSCESSFLGVLKL